MRTLIQYFRSCVCKHDWEREEMEKIFIGTRYDGSTVEKSSIIVSATCKKCGWHKTYSKYNN